MARGYIISTPEILIENADTIPQLPHIAAEWILILNFSVIRSNMKIRIVEVIIITDNGGEMDNF